MNAGVVFGNWIQLKRMLVWAAQLNDKRQNKPVFGD